MARQPEVFVRPLEPAGIVQASSQGRSAAEAAAMFAALDLATGQMFNRFRDRKRWPQFLDFCKQLRRRFPTGKLYVICDNYGLTPKAEVTDWCQDNDVELVFTPTNASWLNWRDPHEASLGTPQDQ